MTKGRSITYSYTDAACSIPGSIAVSTADYTLVYTGGTEDTPFGVATHVNIVLNSVDNDGDVINYTTGPTDYDIYVIFEDRFYFGNYRNARPGVSVATRPNMIDPESFLNRQ